MGRASILCKYFAVSGAGPLTAAGITGVQFLPDVQNADAGKQLIPTRLQLPLFMPDESRSYATFHFWPGLASIYCFFFLRINAFGLQKHFPRWIFPPRKEPQEKDHFIWSKRGAW